MKKITITEKEDLRYPFQLVVDGEIHDNYVSLLRCIKDAEKLYDAKYFEIVVNGGLKIINQIKNKLTIRKIVNELELKIVCISDYIHDHSGEGKHQARSDQFWIEKAIECLKKTELSLVK